MSVKRPSSVGGNSNKLPKVQDQQVGKMGHTKVQKIAGWKKWGWRALSVITAGVAYKFSDTVRLGWSGQCKVKQTSNLNSDSVEEQARQSGITPLTPAEVPSLEEIKKLVNPEDKIDELRQLFDQELAADKSITGFQDTSAWKGIKQAVLELFKNNVDDWTNHLDGTENETLAKQLNLLQYIQKKEPKKEFDLAWNGAPSLEQLYFQGVMIHASGNKLKAKNLANALLSKNVIDQERYDSWQSMFGWAAD